MLSRLVVFVSVFQVVLCLVHFFLYETWVWFWAPSNSFTYMKLGIGLGILSVSFLATSLLAFRFYNILVRAVYRVAAVWLGLVNYSFFAACGCWVLYGLVKLGGLGLERRKLISAFLALALSVTTYGIINGLWVRVTRISVELPNLPEAWRGRVAVLVSDLHLGHVRNLGFSRRIATRIAGLRPEVVFIAGDFYDGTPADLAKLARPWSTLATPRGTYFVEGNHEEFSDPRKYLKALTQAGVRVLNNEKVMVDGLQIVGVNYRDATHGEHFRKALRSTGLKREHPSILLTHAPDRVQVTEEEGISLQLSGHTHRGQFWPWTRFAARIYGPDVYGLQRIGTSQIYTSCGAGTWGPPLRVGTKPEIVLIRFVLRSEPCS